MEKGVENIPRSLIYEMVEGKPIYVRGYKAFLLGQNKSGEPMGSSLLQSMIISQLLLLLHQSLKHDYYLFTNELGVQIAKGTYRAADIAIFKKDQIRAINIDNKYVDIPPKVVIEIDTKAELEEVPDTFTYFNQKTDQLLAFGVERVIWIFTDTQKVMIAQQDQNWEILPWGQVFKVIGNVEINIAELIDKLKE